MHKSIKRVGLAVALVLTAIAILASGGWWMLVQTPDWYAPSVSTDAERAEAAKRVEQTWQDTSNWVAQSQARHQRAATQARVTAGEIASASNDETFEITLTADEINAFVSKWSKLDGWEKSYSKYVTDPRIAIQSGRLIVGGKVNNLPPLSGLIASAHFEPSMDTDGNLRIELASVMGGALPVPGQVWNRYRARLMSGMERVLPRLQRQAALNDYGDSNPSMVGAAMGRLMLQMLNNEPIEPVLFVPVASTEGTRLIPVRVMDVKVTDAKTGSAGSIALTVRAMTIPERNQFLQELQQPYSAVAVVPTE